MKENKASLDFHSKQPMMEKESSVVNLQFVYRPEVHRNVHLCEKEGEVSLDCRETTEKTNLTHPCYEEVEPICSLSNTR